MDARDIIIGPGGPGFIPDNPKPNEEYISKKRVPYKSPTPGEFPLIGIGNMWTRINTTWDQHFF